jgi:hypothetical protein
MTGFRKAPYSHDDPRSITHADTVALRLLLAALRDDDDAGVQAMDEAVNTCPLTAAAVISHLLWRAIEFVPAEDHAKRANIIERVLTTELDKLSAADD